MQLLAASLLLAFLLHHVCVRINAYGMGGEVEVVRLKWYMHDTPFNGPTPSSIPVTAYNASDLQNEFKHFLFGQIYVFDDPLTEGASLTSPSFGRSQGTYSFVSRSQFVAFVSYTVFIRTGEYNGSTLNILGAYPEASALSQQIYTIVGGTGKFMLARGILKEQTINLFGPFNASATLLYHATVFLDKFTHLVL